MVAAEGGRRTGPDRRAKREEYSNNPWVIRGKKVQESIAQRVESESIKGTTGLVLRALGEQIVATITINVRHGLLRPVHPTQSMPNRFSLPVRSEQADAVASVFGRPPFEHREPATPIWTRTPIIEGVYLLEEFISPDGVEGFVRASSKSIIVEHR